MSEKKDQTMNQIIFRAWDDNSKEWLLGSEHSGISLFGECMLMGEWGNIVNRYILQQKDRTQNDLKVMQWSGLNDENGYPIYEGDIVSFSVLTSDASIEHNEGVQLLGDVRDDWILGVCKFYNGAFMISITCDDGEAYAEIGKDTVVMGNIYEDDHLLEE